MNQNSFSLISFDASTAPKIEITVKITHQNNQLDLQYQLRGNLSEMIIPSSDLVPTRQYDLWEHTCFEFFLRLQETTQYWEFNLSPAGDWNVFRFYNYRQDLTEEKAIQTLPFTVSQTATSLQLNLNLNLDCIIGKERNLDVAIATVVENKDLQLSYWALTHPATTPDFHHQDSFVISL